MTSPTRFTNDLAQGVLRVYSRVPNGRLLSFFRILRREDRWIVVHDHVSNTERFFDGVDGFERGSACCRPYLGDDVERMLSARSNSQEDQTVHLCTYASQPDIQIVCDLSLTTPASDEEEASADQNSAPIGEAVHRSDDGRFYTFNREKATCLACLIIHHAAD
jgi:hypothetical protein